MTSLASIIFAVAVEITVFGDNRRRFQGQPSFQEERKSCSINQISTIVDC